MKVLSMWQPYPTLVALGVKGPETRSWSTSYRGPLALAATASIPGLLRGQTLTVGDYTVERDDPRGCRHPAYLLRGPGLAWPYRLPLGAIVATCTLVDVVPTADLYWTGLWPRWAWQQGGGPLYPPQPDPVVRDLPVVVPASQRPYGDFTPGRYAWLLADVVPVNPPVPFKGGQGLTKTWEPAA